MIGSSALDPVARQGAPRRSAAPPALRGRALIRRWTVTVACGEAAGFTAPALAGALGASLPAVAGVPLLLVAGAVEGAVLGWSQTIVLRRALPALDRRRWTALTALGAAAAYLLGLGIAAVSSSTTGWTAIVLGSVAGILLLLTLGGAQWLELRRHVPRAGHWVGWTAAAWLAALGVFLGLATPLWHPGQAIAAVVAVGVGAGIVMALVQAAVTGWGIARLVQQTGDGR